MHSHNYRPINEDQLVSLLQTHNVIEAAAVLGVSRATVNRRLQAKPELRAKAGRPNRTNAAPAQPASLTYAGDTATLIEPPTEQPKLGDIGKLIEARGLDPDEWIIQGVSLNEWDALTAVHRGEEPRTVRLKQWKVSLRRKSSMVIVSPAVHVPTVKRKPHIRTTTKPEIIVVESDSQIPYMDPKLHEASLYMVQDLYRKHNMTEHVFLGDVADFPTISKHAPHAAAMATVNECIQGSYGYLRDKAEAAPNARRRLLRGNHDYRLESELLNHSQGLYGIRPASVDGSEEQDALSLARLLHFDALGIEYVEDPRGWQHGEIELVEGMGGLVCRHGWITSANSAQKSMLKRGRSLIVGHNHRREHTFMYDPSAGIERQGVVIGCMSLVRDRAYPHFTVCDDWNPGFATVTRWPDGTFAIEHAIWNPDNGTLRWRDRSWAA